LSLEWGDTKVYGYEIQALLGTAAYFSEIVVLDIWARLLLVAIAPPPPASQNTEDSAHVGAIGLALEPLA